VGAVISLRTAAWTAAALLAFAGNSWLCRAALRSGAIDAVSFTCVRLTAGALALVACAWLAAPRRTDPLERAGSWVSALALFGYAALFSLAYLRLDAGVGALVLFGAVQITMLVGGWREGGRPAWSEWLAVAISSTGLVLLAAPGAGEAGERDAGMPLAVAAMAAAGVAWGMYSLRGRRAGAPPLAENAGNFARTVPIAIALLALALVAARVTLSPRGFVLALVSGALTSGLGYAAWYAALPGLAPLQAGLVQLAVPVLTALGGVRLFGERLTPRLAVAGALVLAGIALALGTRTTRAVRATRVPRS
jgi:drug/metabolite transporter (DMT)-like permease